MPSDIPDSLSSHRHAFAACRRVARGLVAATFVACTLGSPLSGQTPVPVPAADTTQRRQVGALRPGDVLKIVVFRDKELSNEYPIDARGFVQIPGLGVIQVAGLDPTEVTDRLKLALVERGFARPEISVQPLIRVSVLGEVRSPNVYPIDHGTSLLQLLTVAGGPTDRARLRDTRVIRDGQAFRVDMESGLEGSAAGRIVLYSNDVVVVGRKRGLTSENLGYTVTAASLILAILNIAFLVRQN
jgi:protein involved in polysaccharide export with SLBB domain